MGLTDRREAVIKAAKLWLYHIIPALPLSSLTTLPLFQLSFHLSAAFKTCQLTFQRAGWTSWCLCGGLPLGLCVALSADRHMGSCLCLLAHFCHSHSSHCLCVFNVYAFYFLWANSDLLTHKPGVLLASFKLHTEIKVTSWPKHKLKHLFFFLLSCS